jgi:hypothetical protein
MKSPRDILVAGISFLLGMVFCYFLIAAKLGPSERGAMNFVYHGDADSGTNAVDLRTIKLNWN